MTNMIKNLVAKNEQILFCLDTFNKNQLLEFEVRFRQNNKNTKSKAPSVSIDTFVKLHHFFSNVCDNSQTLIENEFIVSYKNGMRVSQKMLPDKEGSSLIFPWKGGKVFSDNVIIKKRIKNVDITEYGLRFSLSEETPVNFTDDNGGPVLFRTRKRTSYFYENLRVDLSMYKSSDNINSLEKSEILFDVELELLKSENSKLYFPDQLIHFAEQILKIIQETDFVIPDNEINHVLGEYKKLTNSSKFIGCQPETLTESRCVDKDPRNYAITVKLDGKRKMLFAKDKKVYTLDSKLNISFTGITTSDSAMYLVDAEFFNGEYHCFDVLFYNNEDVRWQKLDKRLTMMTDFVSKKINWKNSSNKVNVFCKEYHFDNIMEKISEMKKSHVEGVTDGIIVVPVNKGYPFRKTQKQDDSEAPMKWKPEIMNTVDFKIKKLNKTEFHEKWELLCSGDEKFSYPLSKSKDLGVTDIPIEIARFYMDESVAEFFFDKDSESFFPVKSRHDKLQGNYLGVAVDNFETSINSYDISAFFSKGSSSFKQARSSFFDTRRFHNWIKRSLLDKACVLENSNNMALLDLCCGKGGDIHKWTDNNIRYVEGYDFNSASVSEAVKRFEKVRAKPATKNFDFRFFRKDLSNELVYPMYNQGFDLSTCFFAIHYFFKSNESLETFAKSLQHLKHGKRFIITTLCSKALADLGYQFETENVSIKPVIMGKSVKVHIRGTVLDEETEEHIADYKTLVDVMRKNGLELEETKMFSEYYDSWKQNGNFINYSDRAYSFLNRSYIFVKKSVPSTQEPYLWSDSIPETQIEEDPVSVDISNLSINSNTVVAPDISKMTVKELRTYAESVNIFIPSSVKSKKQIIQMLK